MIVCLFMEKQVVDSGDGGKHEKQDYHERV